MTELEQKLAKIEKVMSLITEGVTKADLTALVDSLQKFVNSSRKLTESEFYSIREHVWTYLRKLTDDTSGQFEGFKKKCADDCEVLMHTLSTKVTTKMAEVDMKLAEVKNGKDADEEVIVSKVLGRMPEPPIETSEDIRNKLELLYGDERLKREAISGLDDYEEVARLAKEPRLGGGGSGPRPILIQAKGVTVDKNVRHINFIGTAVVSAVRSRDGVLTITLNGGGGSAGTQVLEEVPTDSGDHINFTIAQTPLDGTFRLFRGGARQQSIGTSPDFTLTGKNLVLTTALDVANGEQIIVEYQY